MKINTYINEVCDAIIEGGAIKATKYVDHKMIVRGVRKTFRVYGRKPRKGENIEIHLTIGKPNYAEREFIKKYRNKHPAKAFPLAGVVVKNPKTKKNKPVGRKSGSSRSHK